MCDMLKRMMHFLLIFIGIFCLSVEPAHAGLNLVGYFSLSSYMSAFIIWVCTFTWVIRSARKIVSTKSPKNIILKHILLAQIITIYWVFVVELHPLAVVFAICLYGTATVFLEKNKYSKPNLKDFVSLNMFITVFKKIGLCLSIVIGYLALLFMMAFTDTLIITIISFSSVSLIPLLFIFKFNQNPEQKPVQIKTLAIGYGLSLVVGITPILLEFLYES